MRLFLLLQFIFLFSLSASEIKEREYLDKLETGISKVPEFVFLGQSAKKLGVRVWLFGGTAAAYAHYVKADMLHPDIEFDYDYTNIFRSTQDLDIVIDGDVSQAKELEDIIKAKYPQFLGESAKWEVRCLNYDRSERQMKILGDTDFQRQNTDSHSTGIIEVRLQKSNDPIVRDVRDPDNQFLKDVLAEEDHFYYSRDHKKTDRYKKKKAVSGERVRRIFIRRREWDFLI